MWIKLDDELLNLDTVAYMNYVDAELTVFLTSGEEIYFIIDEEKWQGIQTLLTKNETPSYGGHYFSGMPLDAPDGSKYIDCDGREVVKINGEWKKFYAGGGGVRWKHA